MIQFDSLPCALHGPIYGKDVGALPYPRRRTGVERKELDPYDDNGLRARVQQSMTEAQERALCNVFNRALPCFDLQEVVYFNT